MTRGQLYDAASTILQQRISQVYGVGQVFVGGSALPGVRVEVNPSQLNELGLGLEDVRAVLSAANVNSPKGQFADESQSWTITTTDQLLKAKYYKDLLVAYRNGAPVRLADSPTWSIRWRTCATSATSTIKPAVICYIFRQPGANIVETVDRVLATLPLLKASIPASINLRVLMDRTHHHPRLSG